MSKQVTKSKLLIDTSCIPASLGESTPGHCEEFSKHVADGTLYSSIYIRKEFVNRWIRPCIQLAVNVDFYGNMADALRYLEQEFRGREVKSGVHLIAEFLEAKGTIKNTKDAAAEFARLAIAQIKKFDRKFRSLITNKCGCQIGNKSPLVDYNRLFESLREFVTAIGNVEDCPINGFLDFGNTNGPAQKLLAGEGVEKTKAGGNLKEAAEKHLKIECKNCAKIGDAVIALEQPPSWLLVTIDGDFKVLCGATGRNVKIVESLRAVEKETPRLY